MPSTAFTWEDNYPELRRTLEIAGVFRARNDDCTDPVIYEFELKRDECDCRVFLPNAFTPNGDGQNDTVELYSNCQVTKVEASVFDRWGNLIHRSQNPESLWDGSTPKGVAQEGVYIMVVSYELQSNSGIEQEGTSTSEVVLIK